MPNYNLLGQFRKWKLALELVTGNHEMYYRVLLQYGYTKSNQIGDDATAAPILQALQEALTDAKYVRDERHAIQNEGTIGL